MSGAKMSLVDRFESFAADFESCVADDNWDRLNKNFVENATYWSVGGPDPKIRGRSVIINYPKNYVSSNDRRFDSRKLQALSMAEVVGNKLSRLTSEVFTKQAA
jgi:hypothetical protein